MKKLIILLILFVGVGCGEPNYHVIQLETGKYSWIKKSGLFYKYRSFQEFDTYKEAEKSARHHKSPEELIIKTYPEIDSEGMQ